MCALEGKRLDSAIGFGGTMYPGRGNQGGL